MVRVELESQHEFSPAPACIRVYDNNVLVIEITGTIQPEQGADDEWHPCIKLKQTVLPMIIPVGTGMKE